MTQDRLNNAARTPCWIRRRLHHDKAIAGFMVVIALGEYGVDQRPLSISQALGLQYYWYVSAHSPLGPLFKAIQPPPGSLLPAQSVGASLVDYPSDISFVFSSSVMAENCGGF